jgi:hypothetical protein
VSGVVSAGPGSIPAPNHTVVLGNESGEWTTVTNAKGQFEFANRAVGRYGIRVVVPDTHRVLGPGEVQILDTRGCATADLHVAASGRVALTVLEASGKPAVRTSLELIQAESLASDSAKATIVNTHADGTVAWGDVQPGRYVIGLNVTRAPNLRQPQPMLFYPGCGFLCLRRE